MVELFRYIEQAFVVPRHNETIDVTTDSDFQNGLLDAISNGADTTAVRKRADAFLDGVLSAPDGNPLPHSAQYVDLRKRLRALTSPSPGTIKSEVRAVFDRDPDSLVRSDAFKAESILVSDLTVAIKLVTAFDRVDAATVASMRQVMTFLDDFVNGRIKPMTTVTVRRRLAHPLKIPQVFLPRTDADSRPSEPPHPPDPNVTRHDELLKEQAALEQAYHTLMRVHPSQLEVQTLASQGISDGVRRQVPTTDGVAYESDAGAISSRLVIPSRMMDALDHGVRRLIESELRDESTAVASVVGVVKQRWLEVSQDVEPAKLPQPARTYRVGMHLFAVREPQLPANVSTPLAADAPDFSHAVTRPVGVGNLQVVR